MTTKNRKKTVRISQINHRLEETIDIFNRKNNVFRGMSKMPLWNAMECD